MGYVRMWAAQDDPSAPPRGKVLMSSTEILYRAKSGIWNEWVFGDLEQSENRLFLCTDHSRFEIVRDTLNQFSGYFDVDDRRVFYGDILSQNYWGGYSDFYGLAGCFKECGEFLHGYYLSKGSIFNDVLLGIDYPQYLKVIGNIYDDADMRQEIIPLITCAVKYQRKQNFDVFAPDACLNPADSYIEKFVTEMETEP